MTTKGELLRTIRKNCIECMGNQPSLVEGCTAPNCELFEYRMGKDPYKHPGKVAAARKRMAKDSLQCDFDDENQRKG